MKEICDSNKGITLLTLTITVVVMLILTFTVSINVSTYVERKQKTNLETDITKLKEKISHYYNENKTLPIANKYTNIEMLQKHTNDNENYYVIDLSKIENIELNYGKDYEQITDYSVEISDLIDIYIVNEQSHTIYYPKGIEYDGKIYYTTMNLEGIKIEDMTISGIEITGKDTGKINEEIQLTAKIIPTFAQNSGVIWSSGDENIATVDENGKVTLKNSGTVIITATSNDNSEITATHEIQIPQEVSDFDYIGDVQEYIVPVTGTYKIECWGAQGGDIDVYTGGRGAYTAGEIELTKGTKLYVYVGGQGTNSDTGGYNGGGLGNTTYGASGGGATDIRIKDGEWNNTESLISRIMVAGGGGSAENRGEGYGSGNGGYAGGLTGGVGEVTDVTVDNGQFTGNGGTQTLGGTTNSINNTTGSTLYQSGNGSFGIGGTNLNAGGGGGYYGGAASYQGGAGGGSSFISGFEGCNAVNSTGNHTSQIYHYSGYTFTNIQMLAGNELIPNKDNTEETLGNSGNGYARITFFK